MEPIHTQLEKIEAEKMSVLAQEARLKQQRRYEVGLLAEHYGLTGLPNQTLCDIFQKIAFNS